jgi:hypothetical protein
MVHLPWFPNLILDSPKLIGAGFVPTSEISSSAILKQLKLWD